MKHRFPGMIQWLTISSVCFFLAVQVFYHASALALSIAFLDQTDPIRNISFVLGSLFFLTVEILFAGAVFGLFMSAYQCEVLRQVGVKPKVWLLATMVGAVGTYGFFVYAQFLRAYLTGLSTLFDPSLLQCIISAVVISIGQWHVFYRFKLRSNLWVATTIVALGAAIFGAYALRHTFVWALIANMAIAVIYSALLYRGLLQLRLQRSIVI